MNNEFKKNTKQTTPQKREKNDTLHVIHAHVHAYINICTNVGNKSDIVFCTLANFI